MIEAATLGKEDYMRHFVERWTGVWKKSMENDISLIEKGETSIKGSMGEFSLENIRDECNNARTIVATLGHTPFLYVWRIPYA